MLRTIYYDYKIIVLCLTSKITLKAFCFVTTSYVTFALSTFVITSLGEEKAGRLTVRRGWGEKVGRFAWCMPVCPGLVFSLLFPTLPLGARGGLRSLIVALPADLFIVFFLLNHR